MTDFFKRLELLLKHKKIKNVNELALKYLGYKSSEKINRLKKEGNKPSSDIINDLVTAFPDINSKWLLNGSGDMLVSSDEPTNILNDGGNDIEEGKYQTVKNESLSMQAIVNLTKSQTELSISNRILSENNRELITKHSIADAFERMPEASKAKFRQALELLSEVGPGKRFHSEQEVWMSVGAVFYKPTAVYSDKGIQTKKGNDGK